jgi:hypothetical protein
LKELGPGVPAVVTLDVKASLLEKDLAVENPAADHLENLLHLCRKSGLLLAAQRWFS